MKNKRFFSYSTLPISIKKFVSKPNDKALSRFAWLVTALLLLTTLGAFFPTAAQSSGQSMQNAISADRDLRGNSRVNPSSLGMEFSIPLGTYPGRAGNSFPIVFNYSSKVWSETTIWHDPETGIDFPWRYPDFAKKTAAGWKSNLGTFHLKYGLEFEINEANPYEMSYVKRAYVTLTDGSVKELRADDNVRIAPINPQPDMTGTYLAIDGSRMKVIIGAQNSTLFMPSGDRYLFTNSPSQGEDGIPAHTFIDVHGNKMTYDSAAGQWTDTRGIPIAKLQGTIESGLQTLQLPIPIGQSAREVRFVWSKLKDYETGTTALYNPNDAMHSDGSRRCVTGQAPTIAAPHLFQTWCVNSWGVTNPTFRFNPRLLTEIQLPDGTKYKFKYNVYGEIVYIEHPTGAYEKFTYEMIPLFETSISPKINRGVVDRWMSAGAGAPELHWHYQAEALSNPTRYLVTTTNPDLTSEKRYLLQYQASGGATGFSNPLSGMPYDEQVFSSAGQLMSRKLTEWLITGSSATPANEAKRDPRTGREITIVREPGGTYALATMTENIYDTSGSSDAEYFSSTLVKQTKKYGFTVVSESSARDLDYQSLFNLLAGQFAGQQPAAISETDYLYNANYKARNINGLVTETRIKDGSGSVKAKTQISYDEGGYSLSSNGTMPPGAANSWSDPLIELGAILGSKRGLPTTVRSYTDVAASQSVETHNFYDQFGNVRKTKDAKGNNTETEYDDDYAFAYPTKVTNALGHFTTITYDPTTGLPLTTTDANGQVTTMQYNDPLLRPTKTIAPNGHQTITEYGAGTSAATRYVKVRAQIDAANWKEGYTWYDGLGRTIKTQTVDASGDVFVETLFDSVGRVWRTSNPYRAGETIRWTENFYDAAGRLSKVKTLGDGAEVNTAYGLATAGTNIGTVVTVTDQAAKQRRSVTNALGQLTRVDEPTAAGLGTIDAPNQPTFYAYDTLGNLTTVNQGAPQAHRTFAYDSLSRLKSAFNPESGTVQYQYDNNGNLIWKKDARNVITTYGYDALNRVTGRTYAGEATGQQTPPVTYTYDNLPNAIGRLTKVTNGFSTTEYQTFDVIGRVTQSQQSTDGTAYGDPMTYTYNLSGALVEQKYPSGRVVKTVLDSDGDLAAVSSRKTNQIGFRTYASNFAYTAAGAVNSMQLGNGRWESTQFNSRLQPTQIALGTIQSGTDLLKLNFDYGTTANNGNVLSQSITVPTVGAAPGFTATQTYTYDSLNRLKDATELIGGNQSWKQTFLYDRYGNRNFDAANTTTIPVGCPTAVCNPTIDPATNRLIGYTFDDAGNTKIDAEGRTFTYDGENKQTEVRNGQGQIIGQYFYDGDGKRVKKIAYQNNQPIETTIFIYDASGKLVAEYSTQVSTTPQISYLTTDHLGSPRINTNQTGQVIARHDYHPFGEEIITPQRNQGVGYQDDAIRKQFATYERDNESELDFAQARYYSSKLGRFYSVDPENAGAKEDDPQSWNGYAYGRNNPVLYTDPDGLEYRICDNEGKCWTHDDDQIRKAKGAGGFDWEGSRSEKTGLDSGILYDSEGNQIGTYQQTSHDSAIQRMVWGAKPTLDIWQPVIEAIQPMPIPGGAVVGGIVKVTKAGKAANNVRRAILGFRIIERAGDVIHIAVKTAKGEVQVMAHMVNEGGRLVLKKLHVMGSGANSLGVKELRRLEREFAQEIGKREGVKEVIVEGGKRESGANPGKIPRARTYKID